MTEDEWCASRDPIAMVEFLRGRPVGEDAASWSNSHWRLDPATGNDRRFRLLACAVCRRIWDDIPEDVNRAAVEAVEAQTDGRLDGAGLEAAIVASSAVERLADRTQRPEPGYWAVKYLGRGYYKLTPGASAIMVMSTVLLAGDDEYIREAHYQFHNSFFANAGVFLQPFRWPEPVPAAVAAERDAQADLVRCVFGDPFSTTRFERSWVSSTAESLARQMYESRDFGAAAILADALADMGCGDEELLGHLRGLGPHCRGCRGVDLVLGFE